MSALSHTNAKSVKFLRCCDLLTFCLAFLTKTAPFLFFLEYTNGGFVNINTKRQFAFLDVCLQIIPPLPRRQSLQHLLRPC